MKKILREQRRALKKQHRLSPQCFNGNIAFAVTNRGQLIPCCRCDNHATIEYPEFQKLLAVSIISENNTISDILEKPEWEKFYLDLLNHKGMPVCWETCNTSKLKDNMQEIKLINLSTGNETSSHR